MVNIVPGSPGPDTLFGDVDAPDEILGGDGADRIEGRGAGAGETDRLFGEGGDDTLIAIGTFNALSGGDGNDSLAAGGTGIATVEGGAGDDTIIGTAGFAYLAGDSYGDLLAPGGLSGDDVIIGGAGAQVFIGGEGNDTIETGAATTGARDSVFGGDGTDVLVLRGRPQDYAFVQDVSTNFNGSLGGFRIDAIGGAADEHIFLRGIEQVAFGIGASGLAAGGAPLANVGLSNLISGGGNRPTIDINDTVEAAFGATRIEIGIADILGNDVDLEGDPFLLGAFQTNNTIASQVQIIDAPVVAQLGYDPALYPRGLVVVDLVNPLTTPLTFDYLSLDQAANLFGTGATITVRPTAGPAALAADDVFRGTLGGGEQMFGSLLLANDSPGVTITGIVGATFLSGTTWRLGLPNGASVTYTENSTGDPVIRTFNPFTTPQDFSFDYTVEDANGVTGTATVTITVDNNAPIATAQSFTLAAGSSITLQWSDIVFAPGNFDPDGDPIILAFYGGVSPSAGTIQGFGPANPNDPNDFGSFTFTPAAGFAGTATMTYGIQDVPDLLGPERFSPIPSATLSFTVIGTPAAAQDDGAFLATIGRYGFLTGNRLLANDSGTGLTILGLLDDQGTSDPSDDRIVSAITTAHGTLVGLEDAVGGVFGPDNSPQKINLYPFGTILGQGTTYAGPDSFVYVIADANGGQSRATVSLNIANHKPVAVDDSFTTTAGAGSLLIPIADILANDSDIDTGQVLSLSGFVSQNLAGEGTLDYVLTPGAAATQLRYTPRDPTWTGTESFRYFMTDNSDPGGTLSGSANALITVTVGARVNSPPLAVADSFTVQEGRTLAVAAPGLLANDSDPDGDAIRATGFFQPANGTVRVVTNGGLTYTPNPDFVGTDSFTYVLSDGAATTNGTVTITVVEGTPLGGADRYSVHAGQSLLVDAPGVLANDSDPNGDPLTVIALSAAAHGATDLVTNGKLTYTPDPGFVGQDSFSYIISDGVLRSEFITVTIDVTNAPPVAGADSFTVLAGRTLTVAAPGLLANDSDPDGDALQVIAFFEAANGTVGLVTDGSLTYTPNPGFVGTDSFVYKVSDGIATANGTVTIAVVADTSADLSVSLVINAAELPAGDAADVVVRVDNAGAASGGGTLQLTPGLGVSFLGGGEGFDPATGIWSFGPIAAGGFAEFAIETLFATAGTPDIVAEIVTATNPDPDSTPGNGINNGEDDVAAASIAVTLPPASVAMQLADVGSTPEGNAPAAGALTFTILRSGYLDVVSTVAFTLGSGPGQGVTTDDVATVADGGTGLGTGLGAYTVTFAPGETARTITVFSTGDRTPEADETIRLTLTGATGATLSAIAPLSATGTFANDDAYPTIAWAATDGGATPEGNTPVAAGQLDFTLTRSGDLSYASTVTFSVAAGSGGTTADDIALVAQGGTGLGSGFGTFTASFAPGAASTSIFLIAAADKLPEPDEAVVLTLLSASAGTLVQPDARVATGRILNDDTYPTVGFTARSVGVVPEGDDPAAGGVLTFELARTGDLDYRSVLTLGVVLDIDSTADDLSLITWGGNALGAGPGTYDIAFELGQATGFVTVRARGDRLPEAMSVVLLELAPVSGVDTNPATDTAIGGFGDDDIYPTIGWASVDAGATPEGNGPGPGNLLAFEITRSGDLSYASTVIFSVGAGSGGTSAADIALIADGGTAIGSGFGTFQIAFAAGEASRTIFVGAAADTLRENDEGVVLTLLSAGEGTLADGAPLAATGVFLNDDQANSAPVAVADSYTMRSGTTLTIGAPGVLANDSDPDGDPLTGLLLSGLAAHGVVTILADGSFSYAPDAGFSGTDSFAYTIVDGFGGSDTALVTIHVLANGTSRPERLEGTPGPDSLSGRGGADTILGLDGDDLLAGNAGDDSIEGGAGADTLSGGSGADTLRGGADDGLLTLVPRPGGTWRVDVAGGDVINLKAGDGSPDLVRYAAGDGADLVRGFERGIDRIEVALGGGTAQVVQARNGTAILLDGLPGDGVLLAGVVGAVVGVDILFV